MSKGEEKIVKLLNSANISFQREYTFPGLVGLKNVPLRFDFAIFDARGKLKCCLDFDGRQHFEYVPYFHKTIFGFKKQQEWDVRKNKYCLMHNITLIRIPYWDLEDLTLKKIFNSPQYIVRNKYHNLYINASKRKNNQR